MGAYVGEFWRGAWEGRKVSKTWMGGEEGSYKVRIVPEVNKIKDSWIIWTGKKVMDSFRGGVSMTG